VLSRSGALLVMCVTVQQHAARSDGPGVAGFLWGSGFVGQQHAERTTPSYVHRYQDAVAIDGATTKVSRITTMRRTSRNYTRLAAMGNGIHGGPSAPRWRTGSRATAGDAVARAAVRSTITGGTACHRLPLPGDGDRARRGPMW
jgi:hypothetical protein